MDSDALPIKQRPSLNWTVGVGLILAALGLYVSTLAPTVLEADAGEFQFVPWLPGIAHPTGYPLYILLGWLWTHLLPVGEVAWRMNLLSALFAALAVGLTYAIAQNLLDTTLPDTPVPARVIAAALAAATLAVTHTFWSQAIIAEVYTLHTLLVAGILWIALRHRRNQKDKPTKWSGKLLAFAFGLGLTHHITTILLSPALLLFLWVTQPPSERKIVDFRKVKSFIMCGLISLIPLLLYLYLPLVAPLTPYTSLSLSDTQTLTLYNNSVQGFFRHISGTVFAGELRPAAIGMERFILTWQLLRQQVGWVGAIVAISGVITLWQQQASLLLLTGGAFLAFTAFNLTYFIGDVFVLFIPVWLIVCLWLGVGSLGLAHWIAKNFVRSKMGANEYVAFERVRERLSQNMYLVATIFLSVLFFLLPIVLLTTRISQVDQKNNTAASQRWQKILTEPIPKSAVLLSNDRNEIMPMWYYQYVKGSRPDLLGLFPLIVPDPNFSNVGRVLDQALASKRPVYLIKPIDGLGLKARIQPEGTLFRATPYNTPPTYPTSVTLPQIIIPSSSGTEKTETITLLGYDLSPNEIEPGDDITLTLHWQTTQKLSIDYTSYVHLITGDGQGITQSDHRPGGDSYPSNYWQIGEILRDRHTLSIPTDVPAGVYQLRVGMYYQPQPGVIKGMGNGIEIGQLKLRVVGT